VYWRTISFVPAFTQCFGQCLLLFVLCNFIFEKKNLQYNWHNSSFLDRWKWKNRGLKSIPSSYEFRQSPLCSLDLSSKWTKYKVCSRWLPIPCPLVHWPEKLICSSAFTAGVLPTPRFKITWHTLFFPVLGIEHRALHMLSTHSPLNYVSVTMTRVLNFSFTVYLKLPF
jgi:hypothetical protein